MNTPPASAPPSKRTFRDLTTTERCSVVGAFSIPLITGFVHVIWNGTVGTGEFPLLSLALLGSLFATFAAVVRAKIYFWPGADSESWEQAVTALTAGTAGYVLLVSVLTALPWG